MSVRVLSRVLRDSDEKLARRLILIALADSASDDGVAWIGQDTIAAKARLAVSHTKRCLAEMEADGALQVRKAKKGRSRINVYRLNLADLAEVDYERLPFALDAPFDDVLNPDPVSRDDVRSTRSTTSDLREISEARPLIGPVIGPVTPREQSLASVPKLTKINGRDVAFDALAEVCGIAAGSPRLREVAVALSGRRGHPEEGIRAQRWEELRAKHGDERLATIANGREEAWEIALAEVIRDRADEYRRKMNGAHLTPTALAKWWTDLPRLKVNHDGRVSALDILAERDAMRGES